MFGEYHRHVNDCTIHMYSPSGKCLSSAVPEWNRPTTVPHAAPTVKVSFLNRRSQWAGMLMGQAQRLGIAVQFSSEVMEITEVEEHVTVRTKNGLVFEADVCIAASGIGSAVAGLEDTGLRDTTVVSSGYAAARIAWPTNALQPSSPAIRLLDGLPQQPQFRVYLAYDIHLIVFLTETHVAWVVTHIVGGRCIFTLDSLDAANECCRQTAELQNLGTTLLRPAILLRPLKRQVTSGTQLSSVFWSRAPRGSLIGI